MYIFDPKDWEIKSGLSQNYFTCQITNKSTNQKWVRSRIIKSGKNQLFWHYDSINFRESFRYWEFCTFLATCNLLVTSKNETTNSPIHEFKVLHKDQRAFKTPFLTVYYFLFITFKRHFAALWIREFVNSWFRFFDVTNKLLR